MHTFRHPRLFKDVFFAYVLIVFLPLLGAVLVHSLCCNTYIHTIAFECETSGYNYLFGFYTLNAVNTYIQLLSNVRLLVTTTCSVFTFSML